MKLTEILHTMADEKKSGLINVDEWKFENVGHLKDMGFEFDGDYTLSLKSPAIKVSQRKGPKGGIYVVEDEDKGLYQFKDFEDVIKFFDNYRQKEFDHGGE